MNLEVNATAAKTTTKIARKTDHSRWLGFGLNMPGTSSTPGQPQNVTAHMDDEGNIIGGCEPEPLATRYRWRGFIVGVETEYRLLASSVDPLGRIPGILPGQTLQLIVQAVNGTLQGVASEPIQFTVPLVAEAEVAAAAVQAVAGETTAATPNGSNGHANGSRVRR